MNKPPPQLSQTSNYIDKSWTERVQEGKLRAKNNLNGYSRWDSQWWVLDNQSLSDSIKSVNGHVMIGFKNPEEISGVDFKGKTLTSKNNIEEGMVALNAMGITKMEEIKMIPEISAVIEPNRDLIEQIRKHPLIDYIEPDGSVSYSWHKKPQGSSSWQLVGSNSSLSLNLTPSDGSFQLRVSVNDSFDTNEAFKMVDYVNDGVDCPPFELCTD